MPEVVLAYAEADQGAAARVISKLEKRGYKVTRDEVGSRAVRRGAARKPAAPVLLLWSRAFAKSNMPPKRPLATLRLDAAPPPPMVKAPAIDLRAWRGREDHRGWRKLQGALAPHIKASMKAAVIKPQPKATQGVATMTTESSGPSKKSSRLDALIFIAFLALAGGGAYYALFMR
jgi:hypothetical protein